MAENHKPLILVDVDGVLNPWRRTSAAWVKHRASFRGRTYEVALNPFQGQALLQLARETGAELVWATMWSEVANEEIGPRMGLPELPYIDMGADTEPTPYMVHPKTPLVAKYVRNRPFVWFDDELCKEDRKWLKGQPGVGGFQLIHIGKKGLNGKHFDQARAWLNGLRVNA